MSKEYLIPADHRSVVKNGDQIDVGTELFRPIKRRNAPEQSAEPLALEEMQADIEGIAKVKGKKITIEHPILEERTYPVPPNMRLLIEHGDRIEAGSELAEGPLNPQDVLAIRGKASIQKYLVEEVQKVYRSQGVVIHDKHIEIIARQMLRRVRIDYPGETEFLHGELVDRLLWQSINAKMQEEGKEIATAETVLLGVTKVSFLFPAKVYSLANCLVISGLSL